ncbi:hypothetical protein [Bosea sp. ANAM02]|uniref:hypothetical protein n=1 Tax=Bosea sp. ANAM02 TaxID=2020412 RepID=UPI00140EBBA3|nr:hypothetical protein [Bosea sp. ANAM02]BCB18624.1 hypothetical protein OCUBac02_15180 [Bosea sp. ANAM02]
MPKDDIIIAKAMTAGMRRLILAAFVHQKEASPEAADIDSLNEAFRREVGRLAVRGETDDGEDVELIPAVRNDLLLFVDAAFREAAERHERQQISFANSLEIKMSAARARTHRLRYQARAKRR